MEESKINKEPIDQELEQLEMHAPSMRFAKGIVERVSTETSLIKEEKNPLAWIPRICIAGFSGIFIFLIVELSGRNTNYDPTQTTALANMLTMILVAVGGFALLSGLDRLIRKLIVRR